MQIKAVAFDVDGTLYPNSTMYLKSIPFAITHHRLIRAYREVRREIRTIRPLPNFQETEAELLAERLGITADAARDRITNDIHGDWESVLNHVRPYPHIRYCVDSLVEKGIRVAVASDFPVDKKLERLGFDDLFKCRVWSEETGYLKPHPEPFHALARCLEVPADQILYVGNSYVYDVEGAKAVGMMAAHLSRRPVQGSVADLTFHDYRKLASWIIAKS